MLVGPRTGVPRTIGQVAPTQLTQEDPRTVGPKDYWALRLLAPSALVPKDCWAAPLYGNIGLDSVKTGSSYSEPLLKGTQQVEKFASKGY